ncbi:MAG: hypothetical protein ACREDE_11220, partial [Thermoplasmata archaeon]
MTVNTVLVGPGPPTTGVSALDSDQSLMVTAMIPTTGTPAYSWQWLVSVGGGSLSAGSLCTVNSGQGAGPGTAESCIVPAGALTAANSYAFAFEVTDNASTPAVVTSPASTAVSVYPALTPPGAPVPGGTAADVDRPLTVTATLPLTGTPTYLWQWWISVDGGAVAPATQCAANSGAG